MFNSVSNSRRMRSGKSGKENEKISQALWQIVGGSHGFNKLISGNSFFTGSLPPKLKFGNIGVNTFMSSKNSASSQSLNLTASTSLKETTHIFKQKSSIAGNRVSAESGFCESFESDLSQIGNRSRPTSSKGKRTPRELLRHEIDSPTRSFSRCANRGNGSSAFPTPLDICNTEFKGVQKVNWRPNHGFHSDSDHDQCNKTFSSSMESSSCDSIVDSETQLSPPLKSSKMPVKEKVHTKVTHTEQKEDWTFDLNGDSSVRLSPEQDRNNPAGKGHESVEESCHKNGANSHSSSSMHSNFTSQKQSDDILMLVDHDCGTRDGTEKHGRAAGEEHIKTVETESFSRHHSEPVVMLQEPCIQKNRDKLTRAKNGQKVSTLNSDSSGGRFVERSKPVQEIQRNRPSGSQFSENSVQNVNVLETDFSKKHQPGHRIMSPQTRQQTKILVADPVPRRHSMRGKGHPKTTIDKPATCSRLTIENAEKTHKYTVCDLVMDTGCKSSHPLNQPVNTMKEPKVSSDSELGVSSQTLHGVDRPATAEFIRNMKSQVNKARHNPSDESSLASASPITKKLEAGVGRRLRSPKQPLRSPRVCITPLELKYKNIARSSKVKFQIDINSNRDLSSNERPLDNINRNDIDDSLPSDLQPDHQGGGSTKNISSSGSIQCDKSQYVLQKRHGPTPSNAKKAGEEKAKDQKQQNAKDIVLNSWVIKLKRKIVYVEGNRIEDDDEGCWKSSGIVQRISSSTVKTQSGSVYKLKGPMDQSQAEINGLPKILVEKFKLGFPVSWKKLIDEAFSTPVSRTSKRKGQVKSNTTAHHECQDRLCAMCSLSNIIPDSLPRTRSGRVVIPRLDYWCNQHYSVRGGKPVLVTGVPGNVMEIPLPDVVKSCEPQLGSLPRKKYKSSESQDKHVTHKKRVMLNGNLAEPLKSSQKELSTKVGAVEESSNKNKSAVPASKNANSVSYHQMASAESCEGLDEQSKHTAKLNTSSNRVSRGATRIQTCLEDTGARTQAQLQKSLELSADVSNKEPNDISLTVANSRSRRNISPDDDNNNKFVSKETRSVECSKKHNLRTLPDHKQPKPLISDKNLKLQNSNKSKSQHQKPTSLDGSTLRSSKSTNSPKDLSDKITEEPRKEASTSKNVDADSEDNYRVIHREDPTEISGQKNSSSSSLTGSYHSSTVPQPCLSAEKLFEIISTTPKLKNRLRGSSRHAANPGKEAVAAVKELTFSPGKETLVAADSQSSETEINPPENQNPKRRLKSKRIAGKIASNKHNIVTNKLKASVVVQCGLDCDELGSGNPPNVPEVLQNSSNAVDCAQIQGKSIETKRMKDDKHTREGNKDTGEGDILRKKLFPTNINKRKRKAVKYIYSSDSSSDEAEKMSASVLKKRSRVSRTKKLEKLKITEDKADKVFKAVPKNPPAVTAGKGTIARRRQIREYLKHASVGYEVDVFANNKLGANFPTLPQLVGEDESSSEDDMNCMASKTPPACLQLLVPRSSRRTPVFPEHINPRVVNTAERKAVDKYICNRRKKGQESPLAQRPRAINLLDLKSLGNPSELPEGIFQMTTKSDDDYDDEEQDDYFSDAY